MNRCEICQKEIQCNYDNNPDIIPLCDDCYSLPKFEIEMRLRDSGRLCKCGGL